MSGWSPKCIKPLGCRGVALLEFSLTLPLILLFLAGLYDTGRYFAVVSRAAHIAYQVAAVGSVTPPGMTATRLMTERYQQVRSALPLAELYGEQLLEPVYNMDEAQGSITVQITGQMHSLWSRILRLDFPVNVSVVSPVLVRDSNNVGDENDFSN